MRGGLTESLHSNVSFVYPGTTKKALSDLSFTINSGQLVVIVGVNGSGKSTLIKLFNRLYDPSSGTILLDGLPLQNFVVADVRRSMAILCQDHKPYPVNLGENVSLGLPDTKSNRTANKHAKNVKKTKEDVEWAVRQGGAHEFIEKLPERLETTLEPVETAFGNFSGDQNKTLKAALEENTKEKSTSISGGESQRLAA